MFDQVIAYTEKDRTLPFSTSNCVSNSRNREEPKSQNVLGPSFSFFTTIFASMRLLQLALPIFGDTHFFNQLGFNLFSLLIFDCHVRLLQLALPIFGDTHFFLTNQVF